MSLSALSIIRQKEYIKRNENEEEKVNTIMRELLPKCTYVLLMAVNGDPI